MFTFQNVCMLYLLLLVGTWGIYLLITGAITSIFLIYIVYTALLIMTNILLVQSKNRLWLDIVFFFPAFNDENPRIFITFKRLLYFFFSFISLLLIFFPLKFVLSFCFLLSICCWIILGVFLFLIEKLR